MAPQTRRVSRKRDPRDDAELNGKVVVTVDVADDATADEVRAAFAEFDASEQAAK